MQTYKNAMEKATEIYPFEVIFLLKSSSGDLVKTFTVPVGNTDFFEESLKALEYRYRTKAGETNPLKIMKIERVL